MDWQTQQGTIEFRGGRTTARRGDVTMRTHTADSKMSFFFWACLVLIRRSEGFLEFGKHPTSTSSSVSPLFASPDAEECLNRRSFFGTSALASLGLFPNQSHARGLVQLPVTRPLLNTYHLVRAGSSTLDEEDIWSTNPLFLTNRQDGALSDRGVEKARKAALYIQENSPPTVIVHSLAAACVDTANIIGDVNMVGKDRVTSEFTFMDPRAIGKWDLRTRSDVEHAVWAMDADQAGVFGLGGRPPPNMDGTPHETLADQSVRLRQLLSSMETRYSGDTVVLVFPDGTGPALLMAMMAGIPYNQVHEMEFAPGSVILDVTPQKIESIWQPRGDYQEAILDGRQKLSRLMDDRNEDIVSQKDLKIESEQLAIEEALREKRLVESMKREDEAKQLATEQKKLSDEARALAERRTEQNSDKIDMNSLSTLVATGAGISGVVLVASQSISTDNGSEETTGVVGGTNASVMEEGEQPPGETECVTAQNVSFGAEALLETEMYALQPTESERSTVNLTRVSDPVPLVSTTIEEDWATAWIDSIAEILEDDTDVQGRVNGEA